MNIPTVAALAAERAAKVLLDNYGKVKPGDIESKGKNDFFSFVDKSAEKAIVQTVAETFPDHAILAEEEGAQGGNGDYRWVIDPLDGTTNYLRQHNRFAVSIGIEYKGVLEHALVLDPLHNERFTAERGKGAFLNNSRIEVSPVSSVSDALVLFGTPFRSGESVIRTFADVFAKIQSAAADHRRPGVAALDLAYVASGRAEAFYELGLKPWDIAAGALLIKEAGGWVGDFYGDNDDLFRKTYLATNAALREPFLAFFKGTSF